MNVCTRCVMDESAAGFEIDDKGRCGFCGGFIEKMNCASSVSVNSSNDDGAKQIIETIKSGGKRSEYDCVVGVSGGVDSSYALYLAVNSGLKPLAVHLDNGWNSELAVHNINNLVTSLEVDLYTHVIDWPENRDLQRSFFKANVIDIEMLMDNAMLALNYKMARKVGTKWILSGSNTSTEGMAMPANWNWLKFDERNIRNIHRQFGTVKIKTHELISVPKFLINHYLRRIKWLHFLDYFDYRKEQALEVLQKEVGYKPYPYKHYESVFTRFYQGYILPRKFGVDKRKLHLSTLIISGQMTRDEALAILEESPYTDEDQMRADYAFVLKKLGFTEDEFKEYLSTPETPHSRYGSERWLWDGLNKIRKAITP